MNPAQDREKPQVTRELLRRVLKYARPYWRHLVVIIVLILLNSLLELIPPLLYRDLFDVVIPNKDYERLSLLALGMIGIPLLINGLGVAQRYLSARMGEGVIFDLRQSLYNHLQQMSIRFFTHTKAGAIISRFNSDVVGAQNAVTGTLPSLVSNVFSLVTTLAVMLTIEWRLALFSVGVLPLFLIPARAFGKVLREIRRKSMEYNADMNNIVSETLGINGALLMKTFGRQGYELDRYHSTNEKVRDIGVRQAMIGRLLFMALGIASTIGVALTYWIGGSMVLSGAITPGTIVAFAAYLSRLFGPISSLANVQVEFLTSLVSFERVFEYIDKPLEIQDTPGAVRLGEVPGRVKFENVSFDYTEANQRLGIEMAGEKVEENEEENESRRKDGFIPPISTRRWALKNVSFEIEPGELVALVGPSGAGKTTTTYLVPRLYDPTEGRITLDGHDLREVTQESLAQQIGMVTQETYLFHDTIRANLNYARLDADDADLEAAARAANIYDLISKLPYRFDTVVGARGYRLSGGEKQRLAIARVILKDPRILILDEATSHLDSNSEALIQAALQPLMKGRTSLVIAHRLSTILAADKILVMDEGELVEQGTHSELLRGGGLYAQLFETQFRRAPTVEPA